MSFQINVGLLHSRHKKYFKTDLVGYRLPTMNCSPIIKILTLLSSIKINGEKKLLFQASTFKNKLFNSVFQYVLNDFKINIREI